MIIPESFTKITAQRFGDAGAAWVRELPGIADRCMEAWGLTDCVPIAALSINFVCMCRSVVHGNAVLKIQGPHTERYTEIEALRLYDGRGCCRILELDMARAAMLLERVEPGTPLRAHPDRGVQLSVGVEMMRRLPVSIQDGHRLPPYSAWLDNAEAEMRRASAPGSLLDLLESARAQYRMVDAAGEPHVLLHGDLHHDNILKADGDRWVAIDPQGVIGPAVMETGRFIQNHSMEDYGEMDRAEVEGATREVARLLGRPYILVLRALYVLHALSVCWDWEMNVQAEKLHRGLAQCRELLDKIGK